MHVSISSSQGIVWPSPRVFIICIFRNFKQNTIGNMLGEPCLYFKDIPSGVENGFVKLNRKTLLCKFETLWMFCMFVVHTSLGALVIRKLSMAMCSVVSVLRLTPRILSLPASSSSIRQYGYWNKDWQPGKYPQTPEERKAAAKKYNLRAEDYSPHADDGLAPGDYPKVKPYYDGYKDADTNWDFYPHRRNYGEPLEWNQEVYRDGFVDPDEEKYYYRMSFKKMGAILFGSFTTFAFLIYLGEQFKTFPPMMSKQMPGSEETHYTFEKTS